MAVSVYPERMDQIDPEDVEASLRTLETYIHYICERTEFALTNTFRATNDLGESASDLSQAVETARGEVESLGGQVTDLSHSLDGKVDKVEGKGLSANDYTDADRDKLAGIDAGAEANVIETVKRNGTALPVSGKVVDVTVPVNVSDLTNDSGFQDAAQVQTAVAAAVSGVLSEASLFDPTPAVFVTNQTGIAINTGANLRTADVLRNYLSSEGHNLTGSTYRCLCLNSGRVISAAVTQSAFALYKSDFKPVPRASAAKLLMTVRWYRENVGSGTNPPQIFAASYDADGKIWWADIPTTTLGIYRQRYLLDSRVLSNGNLCIVVQFRKPTHTIQANFDLDVVAADSPISAAADLSAMTDSGKIVQEQT